jgi:hypothetical protein
MFKKKEEISSTDNVIIEGTLKKVYNEVNFCDKILELKKFNSDYLDSNFYKETKIELFDLYRMYVEERVGSPAVFLDYVQKNLNTLNLDNLKTVLSEFSHETDASYEDTIKKAKEVGLESKLKEAGIIK